MGHCRTCLEVHPFIIYACYKCGITRSDGGYNACCRLLACNALSCCERPTLNRSRPNPCSMADAMHVTDNKEPLPKRQSETKEASVTPPSTSKTWNPLPKSQKTLANTPHMSALMKPILCLWHISSTDIDSFISVLVQTTTCKSKYSLKQRNNDAPATGYTSVTVSTRSLLCIPGTD